MMVQCFREADSGPHCSTIQEPGLLGEPALFYDGGELSVGKELHVRQAAENELMLNRKGTPPFPRRWDSYFVWSGPVTSVTTRYPCK